jgi:hypothetical protein
MVCLFFLWSTNAHFLVLQATTRCGGTEHWRTRETQLVHNLLGFRHHCGNEGKTTYFDYIIFIFSYNIT